MRRIQTRKLLNLSLVFAAVSLVACGGSGGGGGSQSLDVTGIAATGAPMANATLQIYG